ncbi:rCG20031, isoform CRA_a [Rattus norvegicus]|uniref:RCG20031, isoform CRA_a n=1 Tax=Rattus norvegicus TaxID=10116 RepID=A6KT38_RAT|nr:rCG20031, isoform CRA_a [Rattus norvegicus]EDL85825.1 rCG20031, isoform CRA_a [Rattus norvegicus]
MIAVGSYVQDQARQNPSMERVCGHEVPSLAEESLVIGSCWERKSFL